jgi:hypothetical protein
MPPNSISGAGPPNDKYSNQFKEAAIESFPIHVVCSAFMVCEW